MEKPPMQLPQHFNSLQIENKIYTKELNGNSIS